VDAPKRGKRKTGLLEHWEVGRRTDQASHRRHNNDGEKKTSPDKLLLKSIKN